MHLKIKCGSFTSLWWSPKRVAFSSTVMALPLSKDLAVMCSLLQREREEECGAPPLMFSRGEPQRPELGSWPAHRILLHCAYVTTVVITKGWIFIKSK